MWLGWPAEDIRDPLRSRWLVHYFSNLLEALRLDVSHGQTGNDIQSVTNLVVRTSKSSLALQICDDINGSDTTGTESKLSIALIPIATNTQSWIEQDGFGEYDL